MQCPDVMDPVLAGRDRLLFMYRLIDEGWGPSHMIRLLALGLLMFSGCSCDGDPARRDVGPRDVPELPDSGCLGRTETLCADGCVDLTRSGENCGGCGMACPSNASCLAGMCLADRPLEFVLEWGMPGDVDLHVVRPDGEEIYFASKVAPIGADGLDGELDVDDQTGRGPERIAFTLPVAGDYIVCVNNYGSIDETTMWELTVREDDETQNMLSGEIGPNVGSFSCTESGAELIHTYAP